MIKTFCDRCEVEAVLKLGFIDSLGSIELCPSCLTALAQFLKKKIVYQDEGLL